MCVWTALRGVSGSRKQRESEVTTTSHRPSPFTLSRSPLQPPTHSPPLHTPQTPHRLVPEPHRSAVVSRVKQHNWRLDLYFLHVQGSGTRERTGCCVVMSPLSRGLYPLGKVLPQILAWLVTFQWGPKPGCPLGREREIGLVCLSLVYIYIYRSSVPYLTVRAHLPCLN